MNETQKNQLLAKMMLKGDKVKDLAVLLNITEQAVYNKINGQTKWSPDDIKKISEKYEMSPEETCQIFL